MDRIDFAGLEQELAECTNSYEKVAANLQMEVLRRNQQRDEDVQREELVMKKMKSMLSAAFVALCALALYIVYKIAFGA